MHNWFASIVFAALAIDANAYELMTLAERGESSPIGSRRFRAEDFRKSVLERYGLLYAAARNNKMKQDQGLTQAVKALLTLRDEIVHYKTEWRSAPTVSRRLESILASRIPLNPYCCADVFFPEQCVSVGSAVWAIDTARGFILEFASETGFRPTVGNAA